MEVDGHGASHLAPRERRVLAVLALSPGRVVGQGSLERHLWEGDAPATARKVVQHCVSVLRRELGADRIATTGDGYVLALTEDDVDACVFEREADRGLRLLDEGKPWAAADILAAALSTWRGDALPDLRETAEGASAGRRLDERRLQAEEDLSDARLRCGEHAELVATLREAADAQPLRERRWALLMLALYRSGRQAEALRAFQELRDRLGDELGVEPSPDLVALEEAIVLGKPELDLVAPTVRDAIGDGGAAARNDNLPTSLNSFVGRTQEMTALERGLRTSRLVTVVGPGGCGKTRMALEAGARRVADGEPTWLVDLSRLRDGALVPTTIAQVLGVRASDASSATQAIADAIGDRPVTLILDNCEHVIDDVAVAVESVLHATPNVRAIATSREPLSIVGEQVQRLAPLALPPIETPMDPAALVAYDAVRLFVDRARSHNPDFELDDSTAADVRRLCEHLDGIPLAIELAAARTRTMSVGDIARRLSDRFRLLTTGSRTSQARQQTLEAAIAWSYDLLAPPEQVVLAQLSVFVAPFTLEAAEAVGQPDTGDRDGVGAVVTSLVDRSLVEPFDVGSAMRYRLLESVREYARLKLSHAGAPAAQGAKERHLRYFSARWEGIDPDAPFTGSDRRRRWAEFEAETPDLMLAVGTCRAHSTLPGEEVDFALAVEGGLAVQGDFPRFEEIATALSDRLGDVRDPRRRARVLAQRARAHFFRGELTSFVAADRLALEECDHERLEFEAATILYQLASYVISCGDDADASVRTEVLRRCGQLVTERSDPGAVALARAVMALIAASDVDSLSPEEVAAVDADFDLALQHFETTHNAYYAWNVRQPYANFQMVRGNYERARELTDACLHELDEYSPVGRRLTVLLNMTLIESLRGATQGSATYCSRALRLLDARTAHFSAFAAIAAGLVLSGAQRIDEAAACYGVADSLRRTGVASLEAFESRLLDAGLDHVRDVRGTDESAMLEARWSNVPFNVAKEEVVPTLLALATPNA
jgi:predicted ATPase/DNA-binding SARP family transcriptional activator